jgi:hypothetical protein
MAHSRTGGQRRVITGPYGPHKPERVVIATTDPQTLPDFTTFYLVTNLPAPESEQALTSSLAPASRARSGEALWAAHVGRAESTSRSSTRMAWSQYQVRSDRAMRRHWQLGGSAFSFCWYHQAHASSPSSRASSEGQRSRKLAEKGWGKKRKKSDPRSPGPKRFAS